MGTLELRVLDGDNWKTVMELWTPEDRYIFPNVYSIAEAQFYPKAHSRAICRGEEIVGYTLYGADEDNDELFLIDRFMIGQDFRRQGLGKQALLLLAAEARQQGFPRLETSTAPENKAMQGLLAAAGFLTEGILQDGEIVYFMDLK